MKRLLMALMVVIVSLPFPAIAQRWVDPYTTKDGAYVEGHWENPQDSWQKNYTQPGTTNPLTGQFNTYGRREFPTSGDPASGLSNRNAIPGSSAPNPYALPGSSQKPKASTPSNPSNQGSSGFGR